jgi:hypothetical protein
VGGDDQVIKCWKIGIGFHFSFRIARRSSSTDSGPWPYIEANGTTLPPGYDTTPYYCLLSNICCLQHLDFAPLTSTSTLVVGYGTASRVSFGICQRRHRRTGKLASG